MVYSASVALKRAANGMYPIVASIGNEKPIGKGWGSAKYRTTDMNATLVKIPMNVATAAHLALVSMFVSGFFEQTNLLPIATAAKMPTCIDRVAARLYAGPVGRAPGKIANKTAVFRRETASPATGLIIRNATTMGISHIW